MMAIAALVLDIVLIGLLAVALLFGWRLNQQLVKLRHQKTELEGLLLSFGETTLRCEQGVRSLKVSANEVSDTMQQQINRAVQLRDELQFMSDAADQIANRIIQAAAMRNQEPKSESRPDPKSENRSKAETKIELRADPALDGKSSNKDSYKDNYKDSKIAPLRAAELKTPVETGKEKIRPFANFAKNLAPEDISTAEGSKNSDARQTATQLAPRSKAEKELARVLEKLK